MRKWWKKLGILVGGLVGLGGLLAPAHAQFGPPPGAMSGGGFAAEPQPPCPPDFPNPGRAPSDPVSPFSIKDNGAPNAFTDLESPSATHPYTFTLRGEYLSWWIGRVNLPAPIVTSSTAPNILTDFGALGQPNTVSLLGPGGPSYGPTEGGRATVGLAPGFCPPLEVSGLWINRNLTLFNAASSGATGSQALAIPVQRIDVPTLVGTGTNDAFLAAFPGIGSGAINVTSRFNLWATDIDLFFNVADNGTLALDFIGGYKHAELRESLDIASTFNSFVGTNFNGNTAVPAGFSTSVLDSFAALNRFDGGTLGVRSRLMYSRLMFMLDGKLSLGSTRQQVNLTGTSTLAGGGGSLSVPGGILVGPSNAGVTSRSDFTIIPEANATLSYQLLNNFRVFAGYNVFYWSRVVRAADQVNTAVDSRQIPTDRSFIPGFTGTGPSAPFNTRSFFAHGFNVGLEIGF